MKKRNIIQENIFLKLAKMIAAFQIDKKIGSAMEQIPKDPEVIEAMQQMKRSTQNTIKLLKDYCKRHPDDPKCKEESDSK